MMWSKNKLEKYCKFLTGKNIQISFKKMRKYCAYAYVDRNRIVFDYIKIIKPIIWHECGHIIYHHDTCNAKNEIEATMWSILAALQRGYYKVAVDVVNHVETHSGWLKDDMYKIARKEILKQVGNYGFNL